MHVDFAQGFIWFAAFLFSTTVHEAMHALAAWRLGDPTAYNGGQVSLSPAPHVQREPVGMLIVPLVTSLTQGWAIGWASCPYDPRWAERYPKRAALMAAAGPCGNFVIACAAFLILRAGLAFGWFVAPESVSLDSIVELAKGPSYLTSMLSVLLVQNVFLGTFNLLPLPPLDGSAVLSGLLPGAACGRRAGVLDERNDVDGGSAGRVTGLSGRDRSAVLARPARRLSRRELLLIRRRGRRSAPLRGGDPL
jgi:Zn-dependent protease